MKIAIQSRRVLRDAIVEVNMRWTPFKVGTRARYKLVFESMKLLAGCDANDT